METDKHEWNLVTFTNLNNLNLDSIEEFNAQDLSKGYSKGDPLKKQPLAEEILDEWNESLIQHSNRK